MANRRKFILPTFAASIAAALLFLEALTAPSASAQSKTSAQQPVFDVASIKPAFIPALREGGNRFRIEHTPTSLSMFNVAVDQCVQWAYGVESFQVSATQRFADSYDILAKTGGPATVSQMKLMLQDLMARRFRLAIHHETRMFPVYDLVVAKGGPKLSGSKSGDATVHAAESLPRIQDDAFLFADVAMPQFARMLTQLRGIDLPVVDRTGIKGNFDVLLPAREAAKEADRGALFAIIEQQLGLKLVSAKAPFDVIVIDHAEKPTQN